MPEIKRAAISATIGSERIEALAQLCAQAADHVALARSALHGEEADAEGALDHLDRAIACLKHLSAKGREADLGPPRRALRSGRG